MQQYLEKKEELNSQHKTFFSRRDELSAHISRMDKECFRLNSQKEKLEERQDNQINYLWEEYEVTPGQANTYRMEDMPERRGGEYNGSIQTDTLYGGGFQVQQKDGRLCCFFY